MEVRACIRDLRPYEVLNYNCDIKLDANEISEGIPAKLMRPLNRYPSQEPLLRSLSNYLNVADNQVLLGNGSSELIELLFKTYLDKGDMILGFEKTFSMYKVYAGMLGLRYQGLANGYVMDMDLLIQKAIELKPKMVLVCNPNNPTGYQVSKASLERLCKAFKGLVVIDEAYIEFTEGSMLNRLEAYDNLIILRTFSKAWALAGARVGYMVAGPSIIKNVSKVRPPYNLNTLSQEAALKAIESLELMVDRVRVLNACREWTFKQMQVLGLKVYKSSGNFLYFEASDDLFEALVKRGILIRTFGDGSYRVTIGSQGDMTYFIETLSQVVL